eukprot:766097-Hanusia_phi.AAC.3
MRQENASLSMSLKNTQPGRTRGSRDTTGCIDNAASCGCLKCSQRMERIISTRTSVSSKDTTTGSRTSAGVMEGKASEGPGGGRDRNMVAGTGQVGRFVASRGRYGLRVRAGRGRMKSC